MEVGGGGWGKQNVIIKKEKYCSSTKLGGVFTFYSFNWTLVTMASLQCCKKKEL